MKLAALRQRLQAQDRCTECGLLGVTCLQTEQLIASLEQPRLWRHSICGHILAYRCGTVADWRRPWLSPDQRLFIVSKIG